MYTRQDMEERFKFIYDNSLDINYMIKNSGEYNLNISDIESILFSKGNIKENDSYLKLLKILNDCPIKKDFPDDIVNPQVEKNINMTYIFLKLEEYISQKTSILDLYKIFMEPTAELDEQYMKSK
jgi:hypothetical protein